jgi:hypothetical protein
MISSFKIALSLQILFDKQEVIQYDMKVDNKTKTSKTLSTQMLTNI